MLLQALSLTCVCASVICIAIAVCLAQPKRANKAEYDALVAEELKTWNR
jgi:hypothetical protein